jgi:hypothetical protein
VPITVASALITVRPSSVLSDNRTVPSVRGAAVVIPPVLRRLVVARVSIDYALRYESAAPSEFLSAQRTDKNCPEQHCQNYETPHRYHIDR